MGTVKYYNFRNKNLTKKNRKYSTFIEIVELRRSTLNN